MKVSLDEIKQVFDELIDGKKTREEASSWALKRVFASDEKILEYDPPHDEKNIWEAIIFLAGVDMISTDRPYLFDKEDFIEYKHRLDLWTKKYF